MTWFPARRLAAFLLLAGTPYRIAAGQSSVEYGLGASRAPTTTAPARGLGKQVGGLVDSLNHTVKSQSAGAPETKSPEGPPKPVRAIKSESKTTSYPASSTVVYENPQQIPVGVGYEELVRRFGPPSMSISTGAGRTTLSYLGHDGAVEVELDGGRVITVAGGLTAAKSTLATHQ
jgi:hypothetical protein